MHFFEKWIFSRFLWFRNFLSEIFEKLLCHLFRKVLIFSNFILPSYLDRIFRNYKLSRICGDTFSNIKVPSSLESCKVSKTLVNFSKIWYFRKQLYNSFFANIIFSRKQTWTILFRKTCYFEKLDNFFLANLIFSKKLGQFFRKPVIFEILVKVLQTCFRELGQSFANLKFSRTWNLVISRELGNSPTRRSYWS